MFGQVFPSPIPKPLPPTTVHHIPATASTVLPTPEAFFHGNAMTSLTLLLFPNALLSKIIPSLPCRFLGTLFGQDSYSVITVAPIPEPVAPPPAAIAVVPPPAAIAVISYAIP
jgi:hypothetical protein